MPSKTPALKAFTDPETRITAETSARLEALAPAFLLQVTRGTDEAGIEYVELAGPGFSGPAPLRLAPVDAKIRLLAEIASILARWVPFNLWEPAEVTLFALPSQRVERCANSWRKQLAQQAKALALAEANRRATLVLQGMAADVAAPLNPFDAVQ